MYSYVISCTVDENETEESGEQTEQVEPSELVQQVKLTHLNEQTDPVQPGEHVQPVIETSPIANPQADAKVPPSKFDPFNVPYQVRDKVKEKFKNYLGGREKVLGIGGAAVPRELIKFLSYCFEGMVQEGYGTTEVSL